MNKSFSSDAEKMVIVPVIKRRTN